MIILGKVMLIDEEGKFFNLLSTKDKMYKVPYTDADFELVKRNFDQGETTMVEVKLSDTEEKKIESITIS